MDLIINQKEFYQGIQIVQKAVSSKNTLPILKGIYLEANKEKGLKLIANNLEIGIEYWTNANVKEEGVIVIPANELTNIIRELPSGEVSLTVNKDNYMVNIECLNSKFVLKAYDAEEFPQLPEVDNALKVNVKANKFHRMINEVKFSTSNDQTQPALTGALFILDDEDINLVATNTYRLAFSNMKNDQEINENLSVILPGSTLNELYQLLETDEDNNIELLLNDSYVRFTFNNIIFISRLIEGKFPNYKQVLPTEFNSSLKIDRVDFLNAVKRVSLIARLDSNVISLNINQDKMLIKSNSSEYGNAEEFIEVELNGPEQNIDIDASYLIDVLKVLDEEIIHMEMIGPLNPLTIRKDNESNFIYLIMPVRPGA
ncbi:DNA polymerase III subunit beta [Natronospora cellulosivora (SeqCode)]